MVCHKVAIKVLAEDLQAHLRIQPEKDLPAHSLSKYWQYTVSDVTEGLSS